MSIWILVLAFASFNKTFTCIHPRTLLIRRFALEIYRKGFDFEKNLVEMCIGFWHSISRLHANEGLYDRYQWTTRHIIQIHSTKIILHHQEDFDNSRDLIHNNFFFVPLVIKKAMHMIKERASLNDSSEATIQVAREQRKVSSLQILTRNSAIYATNYMVVSSMPSSSCLHI